MLADSVCAARRPSSALHVQIQTTCTALRRQVVASGPVQLDCYRVARSVRLTARSHAGPAVAAACGAAAASMADNTAAVPKGLAAQSRVIWTFLICFLQAAWVVFIQRPLSGKAHPLGWPRMQQLLIVLFRIMGDYESVEAPRVMGGSLVGDASKWPKELHIQQVTTAGSPSPPAYWISLRDNPAAAAGGKRVNLFYIHGGGFFCGHPLQYLTEHSQWLRALAAKGIEAKILAVDYLWAPEHPFPAALDAVVAAYEWLVRDSAEHADIVVGGDSAGGTLALSLLFNVRDRLLQQQKQQQNQDQQEQQGTLRQPVAALLISPHVDFSESALVFSKEWLAQNAVAAQHDIIPPGTHVWWKHFLGRYLGKRQELRSDPRVSPILNPNAGQLVAPGGKLLMVAGGAEVMIGDILRFVDKARADGTAVDVLVEEQEVHGWALFALPHQAAKHRALYERIARAVADSCGAASGSSGAKAV